MFDGIEVWGLCRPLQHFDSIVLEPFAGSAGGVFRIVVLLEDDRARVQLIILEGSEEFVAEDMRVQLCINTSVDLACVATPWAVMHPQIIRLPPPNLTVP